MADRCDRCGARLESRVVGNHSEQGECANRACGMCPDYKPALLAAVPDPEDERRAFIRMHASALVAAHLCGLVASQNREPTLLSFEKAWEWSCELWDAKPENC